MMDVPSLKHLAPKNVWLEYDSFLLGRLGLFSGALSVVFREVVPFSLAPKKYMFHLNDPSLFNQLTVLEAAPWKRGTSIFNDSFV